jgi:hypothetical protein
LKRSQALRSLSRDHHRALTVGQRLRRADDHLEANAAFLAFWQPHGASHFRIEEETLLPHWGMFGNVVDEAVARVAKEHLSIRCAAIRARQAPLSMPDLRQLGDELVAHVRFEERELFPAIEADLGPADLVRLAEAVERAEAGLR